jgi:hypothetical protein
MRGHIQDIYTEVLGGVVDLGTVVDWGTMLQAGMSRIQLLLRSLEFLIDLILAAALWP